MWRLLFVVATAAAQMQSQNPVGPPLTQPPQQPVGSITTGPIITGPITITEATTAQPLPAQPQQPLSQQPLSQQPQSQQPLSQQPQPQQPTLLPAQPIEQAASTQPSAQSSSTGTCVNSRTQVAVFMTWDVQIKQDLQHVTQQDWSDTTCANCPSGNMKLFPIEGTMNAEDIQSGSDVVTQCTCPLPSQLCIETIDGSTFQGFAPSSNNTLLLTIFSSCDASGLNCEPHAVLDAPMSDDGSFANMGVTQVRGPGFNKQQPLMLSVEEHLQPRMTGAAKMFLPATEFNYLRVKGVSCNSCSQPIDYC